MAYIPGGLTISSGSVSLMRIQNSNSWFERGELSIGESVQTQEFHPTPEFFARPLPARGAAVLRLGVAGLTFRFEGLEPDEASRIRTRYGLFVLESGADPRDLRIRVGEARTSHFLLAAASLEGGPEVYRLEQRWYRDLLLAYSYDFAGCFDARTGVGELAVARGTHEVLLRAVENFLRVLTAHLVLERGGFLLHGAGVVRDGRAHVFFGPSGAGKTTVTLLSEGDLILSDDLVLVRPAAGGHEAAAVPFRGVCRRPPDTDRAFPLAALYRLIQYPADELELLPPARGAAEMMASLPFVVQAGGSASRALEVVSQAATSAPVYRLRFRKSPEFWDLLAEK